MSNNAKTSKQVIDIIMEEFKGSLLEDTVDTFKIGNIESELKSIVTTFTATIEVIEKAIEIGANLIITHEPTFYDHRDNTEWLESSKVYHYKLKLLQDNGIVVWRFHDYLHMLKPDGINVGLIKELQWEEYIDKKNSSILNIPQTTLKELILFLKQKLNAFAVRYVGNIGAEITRIGITPGALPGDFHISFIEENNLEVLICGETSEWQACEYIRDAVHKGLNKAIIIIGHVNSEEAGMKYLVEWLKPKIGDVPIVHIPAGDPMKNI